MINDLRDIRIMLGQPVEQAVDEWYRQRQVTRITAKRYFGWDYQWVHIREQVAEQALDAWQDARSQGGITLQEFLHEAFNRTYINAQTFQFLNGLDFHDRVIDVLIDLLQDSPSYHNYQPVELARMLSKVTDETLMASCGSIAAAERLADRVTAA